MYMCVTRITTFIINIPNIPITIFIGVNIRFVDPNSLVKINCLTCIMFSTVGTRYERYNIVTIKWQLTFYEVSHCTPEFILNNQKIFRNLLFIHSY